MEYVKPFTYFVGATGGFTNWLLCGVVNLIPVVGQIVLLGYRAEVAEELIRDPALRRHPKFDFNLFGDYLSRGVWPFLYQLVIGLGVGALLGVGFLLIGVAMATLGKKATPEVVALLFALGYLVVIVLMTLTTTLILWPMELHAQLSRRFVPVEAFGFASRFQRVMWGQMLTSVIVFLLFSAPIAVLGLLACYFGYFWAIVVMFMAQQHIMSQLYRLYLDAGGDPIPTPEDEYDDEDDDLE